MNGKKISIVVLCGFLGSGKTTLLRRWRRAERWQKAAVIVHDLSELGIDAEVVSGEDPVPAAGTTSGLITALHGIHAAEKLHESLAATLQRIHALEPAPPAVLVESTGAAKALPLIQALTQHPGFVLRHFMVTVDALNLLRDFGEGRCLPGNDPELAPPDPALAMAATVMAEQIRCANIIILTKTDAVPRAAVERMVPWLNRLNPRAAIALSSYAGLDYPLLEKVPPPDLTDLPIPSSDLPESPTAPGIGALTFRGSRPLNPQRLFDLCQTGLGTGLYRVKGFLWLISRPGQVLLWQQSGSQISLEFHGLWKSELVHNREGKLLPEEVAALRVQLEQHPGAFGDRLCELTIIGLAEDRQSFAEGLRDCVCTDAEIAAWQQGETYPDPWPSKLKMIR
jgi:G3E family GTPase